MHAHAHTRTYTRAQDFTRHFMKRTTTPELRAHLKTLTVSLCKSSKTAAGVLMVELKPDKK